LLERRDGGPHQEKLPALDRTAQAEDSVASPLTTVVNYVFRWEQGAERAH
jgi:hypothetical protein